MLFLVQLLSRGIAWLKLGLIDNTEVFSSVLQDNLKVVTQYGPFHHGASLAKKNIQYQPWNKGEFSRTVNFVLGLSIISPVFMILSHKLWIAESSCWLSKCLHL